MNELIASVSRTREILMENGLKAKKNFGQNFLVDSSVVLKVQSEIMEDDHVIEIGPGLGALTEVLAMKAKEVRAYEIDEQLVPILNDNLKQYANLTVYNEDFTQFDLNSLDKDIEWVIVSNLPYYITSELLLKIFKCRLKIKKIITMMQKEVAERFVVKDNIKDRNALSVLIECRSKVKTLCKVSRNCFIPAPNVDNTILVFELVNDYENVDWEVFAKVCEMCFKQRRKTLNANLNEYKWALERCAIAPQMRAEQLSIKQFMQLYEVILNEGQSLQ